MSGASTSSGSVDFFWKLRGGHGYPPAGAFSSKDGPLGGLAGPVDRARHPAAPCAVLSAAGHRWLDAAEHQAARGIGIVAGPELLPEPNELLAGEMAVAVAV